MRLLAVPSRLCAALLAELDDASERCVKPLSCLSVVKNKSDDTVGLKLVPADEPGFEGRDLDAEDRPLKESSAFELRTPRP